ncbi:MAG: hypothetical protein O3A06_11770 [Proteobacteria bacterium]|nr:hypothetical protein [Pseudomonadota bacterium]
MPTGDFLDKRFLIDSRELGKRLGAISLIDLRLAEDFLLDRTDLPPLAVLVIRQEVRLQG